MTAHVINHQLHDQVGVIRSASGGLGRAALAFAQAGADVALQARSEVDLKEIAASPKEMVLYEIIVTPLEEQGWP